MEGIEQNPVVYDLMSEMAFRNNKVDVKVQLFCYYFKNMTTHLLRCQLYSCSTFAKLAENISWIKLIIPKSHSYDCLKMIVVLFLFYHHVKYLRMEETEIHKEVTITWNCYINEHNW